eukprot:4420195-Amphidinium_carterae.1
MEPVPWAYIDPNDQVRVGFTSESMRKWSAGIARSAQMPPSLTKQPTQLRAHHNCPHTSFPPANKPEFS